MSLHWPEIFDEFNSQPAASENQVRQLHESMVMPLTDQEIAELEAQHRQFKFKYDIRAWVFPAGPLPPSYLSLLGFSNGGNFRNGGRCLHPLFATDEVRGYLLGYNLPEHIPHTFPFAMDGSGVIYLFDMRQPPVDGEYPVLVSHAGSLSYGCCGKVADSFLECCRGTEEVFELAHSSG
jgi:hypothetical protein